jgi:hypothetical protein
LLEGAATTLVARRARLKRVAGKTILNSGCRARKSCFRRAVGIERSLELGKTYRHILLTLYTCLRAEYTILKKHDLSQRFNGHVRQLQFQMDGGGSRKGLLLP